MKTRTALILLALTLVLPFVTRAQIVSNCNTGGDSPIGTAGGVLGGTYPNPAFNSTNTAGNTMNNALSVNNLNGNNGRIDLEVGFDSVSGDGETLFLDGSATPNHLFGSYLYGSSDNPLSPTYTSLEIGARDNTGANEFDIFSPAYTGGVPGGYAVFGGTFGANALTDTSGVASPAFPYGAGIAITIASGYPPCDGGENLNAPGFVVDAASCADGVQPAAGGGTHCPVFCDGVLWRALYTVAASTPLPSPTPTPTPVPTQTPTATPT